MESRLHLLLF